MSIQPTKSNTLQEQYHIFDTNIWIYYFSIKFHEHNDSNKEIIENLINDKIEYIINDEDIFIPAIVYAEAIDVFRVKFNKELKNKRKEKFAEYVRDIDSNSNLERDKDLEILEINRERYNKYKSAIEMLNQHYNYSITKYLHIFDKILEHSHSEILSDVQSDMDDIEKLVEIEKKHHRIKNVVKENINHKDLKVQLNIYLEKYENIIHAKMEMLKKIHDKIMKSDEYKKQNQNILESIKTFNLNEISKETKKYIDESDKKITKELVYMSFIQPIINKKINKRSQILYFILLHGDLMKSIFDYDAQKYLNTNTIIRNEFNNLKIKKDKIDRSYYNAANPHHIDYEKDGNIRNNDYKKAIKNLRNNYIKKILEFITKKHREINQIVNKLTDADMKFYKKQYEEIGMPIRNGLKFKEQLADNIKSCMAYPWIINAVNDKDILVTAILFKKFEMSTDIIFHTTDKDYYRYVSKAKDLGVTIKKHGS